MKTLIFIALLASLMTGNSNASEDSCDLPGRDRKLCIRMKGLRVRLNLIDAQLDLQQTRYSYYRAISEDMDFWIRGILIESRDSSHLQSLDQVRKTAREVSFHAGKQDFRALQVANTLRSQCMSCHSTQNPRSGRNWKEIAQGASA